MYDYYKIARNKSWDVLISAGINSLPVDLGTIAKHYEIHLIRYSKCALLEVFNPETISGDGFITRINEQRFIFFNDTIKTRGRRRFTVAHELGHGILNHPLAGIVARNSETDSPDDPLEMQANIFARDILAPACVLNALCVTSVFEIMKICAISEQSARIRLERLQLLQKRGMFGASPLEQKVQRQFSEFIVNNRKKTKNARSL